MAELPELIVSFKRSVYEQVVGEFGHRGIARCLIGWLPMRAGSQRRPAPVA